MALDTFTDAKFDNRLKFFVYGITIVGTKGETKADFENLSDEQLSDHEFHVFAARCPENPKFGYASYDEAVETGGRFNHETYDDLTVLGFPAGMEGAPPYMELFHEKPVIQAKVEPPAHPPVQEIGGYTLTQALIEYKKGANSAAALRKALRCREQTASALFKELIAQGLIIPPNRADYQTKVHGRPPARKPEVYTLDMALIAYKDGADTYKKMQKALRCSESRATALLRELRRKGLAGPARIPKGFVGKPNPTYKVQPAPKADGTFNQPAAPNTFETLLNELTNKFLTP
jgi:exonuclease VII small subunit